jgi:hypothetical protein
MFLAQTDCGFLFNKDNSWLTQTIINVTFNCTEKYIKVFVAGFDISKTLSQIKGIDNY